MRRILFIGLFLLLSIGTGRAQYNYNWSVGGGIGMGPAEDSDGFAMAFGMNIGFNKVIQDTKWRWGMEGGGFELGTMNGLDEEDDSVRPDFKYIGGIVDYNFHTEGIAVFFARVGLAPAHQRDVYLDHIDHRFSVLGIAGLGTDIGINRLMLSLYMSHRGIPAVLFSYGWYFGKKASP